jgi:hypothetical protein
MDDLGPLSATQADANQPYSATIALGGTNETLQPITGLPPGLSATQSGTTITLSGTPTQTGTFPFDVNVSVLSRIANTTYHDGGVYSLTINPALSLGGLSTAPWTAGQAGSAAVAVSGGTPAYSNLSATGLPPGLTATLSANAISFSGTPTQAGTFSNLAVALRDSTGATVRQTYSMTVSLGLSSLTPSAVTAGQSYAGSVSVTRGGSGHYNYTLLSGSALPAGVVFSDSGGAARLTGTPTVAGTYRFSVKATDAVTPSLTGTQSYTLTVTSAAASRLVLSADPTVHAGQTFQPSVQAFDRYGNGVPGVPVTLGGMTVQTSDGGVAGFSLAAPTHPGTYTLSAWAPGLAPVTSTYTVLAGFLDHFVLRLSTNQTTAGSSFHVAITGLDRYGNLSDYSDVALLQSSDGQPVTPGSIPMSHGAGEGDVTLYRAGTVTLTATNVYALCQGTSGAITVNPAAATHFAVTPAVTSAYAGTPVTLTITAQDQYGNTATSYGGNVALSSSDGQAVSPSAATLTHGTASVPVTLGPATSGDIMFTARAGALSGTSPSVHFLPQAGNGAAVAQVSDAAGDTLVLYTDGTVWEQQHGGSLWYKVEDRVSRLVSDAQGNVFTLDWNCNVKKLTSLYVWTQVQANVPSLVSDAWGEVFLLNSGDHKVYEYSGNGLAQWSAWVVNTPPYLPAETMVRDAAGNVFVQAGRDALYIHRPGAANGGLGWWDLLSNGLTDLVTNASGQMLALTGLHTVCQLGPDSNGAWSTGLHLTGTLGNVNALAALPNGTLLAVGSDGILRSSSTGQSGTWQTSYSETAGVYTIAVTPNGVAYELAYSGRMKYSTTGLPSSWLTAYYYAPVDGVQAGDDVHGLANGRDGRVYFLAGGNVYQILSDGVGTVVRDQVASKSTNGKSFDQALNSVGVQNAMGKVSNFLQQLDGTDQTATMVANEVGQLLNTSAQVNVLAIVYDGYQVAKDGFDVVKDIESEDPELILDTLQLIIDTNALINAC